MAVGQWAADAGFIFARPSLVWWGSRPGPLDLHARDSRHVLGHQTGVRLELVRPR